jgi:hypothetical protein
VGARAEEGVGEGRGTAETAGRLEAQVMRWDWDDGKGKERRGFEDWGNALGEDGGMDVQATVLAAVEDAWGDEEAEGDGNEEVDGLVVDLWELGW